MRLHMCLMVVVSLLSAAGHADCRASGDRSKEIGNGAVGGFKTLIRTQNHIIGNGALDELSESDLMRLQRVVSQLEAATGGDPVTSVTFDADDSEPVFEFTQSSGVTDVPVSCVLTRSI